MGAPVIALLPFALDTLAALALMRACSRSTLRAWVLALVAAGLFLEAFALSLGAAIPKVRGQGERSARPARLCSVDRSNARPESRHTTNKLRAA